jgi:hypothetical protein
VGFVLHFLLIIASFQSVVYEGNGSEENELCSDPRGRRANRTELLLLLLHVRKTRTRRAREEEEEERVCLEEGLDAPKRWDRHCAS